MALCKKILPVALGIALGLGVVAGGAAAAPVAEGTSAASQPQSQDTLRATLGNGLRVVLVRDTLAPVVTTQVTYLAGGYEAPKDYPGTAHALEHMMFRDSEGLSGAQMHEIIGKLGAGMNAFTTEDATQYYFVAPANYVDALLKIESIRMRGAQLTDKDWNLEKGAIEQEVSRDISSPDFLAFSAAEKALFDGTGYADSPLGTRPSFDKTTGAILQKFYDQWYRPNNAVLVIAGDIDLQPTMEKVKQLFGGLPRGDVPAPKAVRLATFKPQTIRTTTPDATGSVEYMYRVPGQRSQDYAAIQVLMHVLNNSRSSLSALALNGKALSTGAGTQSFVHGGMGMIIASLPKGGDSEQVAADLDGVINNVLTYGVRADLVQAAKNQLRARYEFSRSSISGLASAWSQALAWRGVDSPKAALDQMLAVTPADVDRVARKYFQPDLRVTLVNTPNADGKRPAHSSGFGGTESFASDDKLDVALPNWATKALADLRMPQWTLDPVRMKLANGITLIVQPESVSKTYIVSGYIDTDENLQAPKGQDGVGSVLARLFDYGSTSMDRTAFHKALDEIASKERGGTSFYLLGPSEHFDCGMQLLAANELHPALPQHAFTVQKEKLASKLKGAMATPKYKLGRALKEALLPAGDPGLRQATAATVDSLTLADAKAYYTSTYRPDMTTIVVVGDVTPAQAKAEVEKYFGSWKASGPRPNVIPKAIPINQAAYAVVPNAYASQDRVLMAQVLDLDIHNPDRYALELGNTVLGGNAFASRLMNDVRVRHGYAYGASSKLRVGRSRSTFYVTYGSDPAKVGAVDKLIDADIQSMRTTSIKPDELANAKQALIRSIPLSVSSTGQIGQSLLTWSVNGQPLDEPMVAAKHYMDMDAGTVQAAFKKYIHPDRMVQVVEGPKPTSH